MMPTRPILLALLPAAAAAASLAACTTPHVKPTLSQAVVDARAHKNASAQAACTPLISPLSVGFGFGEAQLSDIAAPALDSAGQLLTCHPQAAAIVVGAADGHGTAQEQTALAAARAQAVAQELQRRGVAAERVKTQVEGTAPAGDDNRLVILAEGRRW
jgi:outer membrane protein OmpA-like peptidoglycan-associated protein